MCSVVVRCEQLLCGGDGGPCPRGEDSSKGGGRTASQHNLYIQDNKLKNVFLPGIYCCEAKRPRVPTVLCVKSHDF